MYRYKIEVTKAVEKNLSRLSKRACLRRLTANCAPSLGGVWGHLSVELPVLGGCFEVRDCVNFGLFD
jgi:hypothetical protein